MISEESFRLFSYVIRVGHRTKILPYKWNPISYKVEVVPNLNRWRLTAVANFVIQCALIWSALVGVCEPGATLEEWMFFTILALGPALAIVLQFYNFVHPSEFAALLSRSHLFAWRLALYHRLDTRKKDGMERLAKCFLVSLAALPIIAGVVDAVLVHRGDDRLFRYFRTEYLGLNILVGFARGYVCVFPVLTSSFFVMLAVSYTHSMDNFLRKIRFNPDRSELQLKRDHLLFRAHQVLHLQAAEFTANLIMMIFGFGCLFQITSICITIQMGAKIQVVNTIVVAYLATGATKACLKFAMKYTEASREFPASFQAWCKEMKNGQIALQKGQRFEFRTYRPFYFKIGSFLHITDTTFAVASSDVVLQGVWTILLM